MNAIITLQGIDLSFRGNVIFTGFTHSFERGQTYYIAGENGTGKSVLLKLICGFIKPDAGEIILHDSLRLGSGRYPLDFGVIVDRPGFIPDLTARANLEFLAGLRKVAGPERITEVLERVGLEPNLKTKVKNFSLGMKQRLSLAQAILEEPSVLLLDEAFNALDEDGKEMVRGIIREYRERGATIIMTTHHFSDVAGLADHYLRLEKSGLAPVDPK